MDKAKALGDKVILPTCRAATTILLTEPREFSYKSFLLTLFIMKNDHSQVSVEIVENLNSWAQAFGTGTKKSHNEFCGYL